MVIILQPQWSRSSMDRMTDSGSVGWAFESPRDHETQKRLICRFFLYIAGIRKLRIRGDENAKGWRIYTRNISIISVIALASEGSFTGDKPSNDLALLRSLREI